MAMAKVGKVDKVVQPLVPILQKLDFFVASGHGGDGTFLGSVMLFIHVGGRIPHVPEGLVGIFMLGTSSLLNVYELCEHCSKFLNLICHELHSIH